MVKKLSRRSFIKRMLKIGIISVGTSSSIYYYAHNIEPSMLQITEHTITHKAIPKGFNGFKIVQFSDTHLGFNYNLDQFEQLITKINTLDPDVIFFTGDLMDAPNQYPNPQEITPILKRLNAPFGKFSIYGNHDHGGYGSDIYKTIMVESDFSILQNQANKLNLLDGSEMYILGLDDAMLGKPDITSMMAGVPDESYKILLCHEPDLATQAQFHGIQLQLSGHSHGGQIQIPFIGPLVTPPLAEKYHEGFYDLGNLTLYVNRGIGTTRLPFRFLSQPEVTVFQLASL
jgi:uncharacterized protein